jgi:S-layer protein
MAKEQIDRASRAGVEEAAAASNQHNAAELLKKMKVLADADDAHAHASTSAEAPAADQAAVDAPAAQMVASADSIFASDAASFEVADAGTTASDAGGSSGGISTGTLLAIGGVALVGGGIAIAANKDGGGHHHGSDDVAVTAVTASAASVDEGHAISFNVTGTPNTDFAYTITGVDSSDVDALSGTVHIGADGKGVITVITTADQANEGAETLTVTVGGQSASATINDTSAVAPEDLTFTTDQNETRTGSDGDDTFNAALVGTALGTQAMTFQNGDVADGGAGHDTLNVSVLQNSIGAVLGGTNVLDLDTTSIETVNINVVNAAGGIGAPGVQYVYIANDVTELSVVGSNPAGGNSGPAGPNDLVVFGAGGVTDASVENMTNFTLGDLTADTLNLDVSNTRTASLAALNQSIITIGADPSDATGAAVTLNLTVDTGNAAGATYDPVTGAITGSQNQYGYVAVNSDDTVDLNLTVAGNGHFAVGSYGDYEYGTQDNVAIISSNLDNVKIDGNGDVYLYMLNDTGGTSAYISTLDASALNGGVSVDINYADYDAGTGASLLSLVNGGKGNDYINIDAQLGDGIAINTGTGNDYLSVHGDADGDTSITLGDGDDYLHLHNDNSQGTLTVDGGAGDDYLDLVTTVIGAGYQVTLNGGAGDDYIDVSGITYTGAAADLLVSIDAGAGDDVLNARVGTPLLPLLTAANYDYTTHNSTLHITANGGDGVDTLQLTVADAIDITANDAASSTDPDGIFNATVSGFEILDIDDGNDLYDVVDMDVLDNMNQVILQGSVVGGIINHLDSGGSVTLTDTSTDLVVNVTDATLVGNNSDVLNLNLAGVAVGATQAEGVVHVIGVDTLNINTDGLAGVGTAGVFTLTLDDQDTTTAVLASLDKIVVTGDAGLDLSEQDGPNAGPPANDGDLSHVTVFDASGVTAGSVTFESTNLHDSVTITGGAGDDVLTGNVHADTIVGGAGDDRIDGGGALDTLTGGEGADTFVLDTNANGTTFATVTDFSTTDTSASGAVGDSIDVSTIATGDVAGNTVASFSELPAQASIASFQDYLDAATAGDVASGGTATWFEYQGNTYVVVDVSADNTFQNGQDQVIELHGTGLGLEDYTATAGVIAHP